MKFRLSFFVFGLQADLKRDHYKNQKGITIRIKKGQARKLAYTPNRWALPQSWIFGSQSRL